MEGNSIRKALRFGLSILTILAFSPSVAETLPELEPRFSEAVAFDTSRPAREIAALSSAGRFALPANDEGLLEVRPDPESPVVDSGFGGDGALSANNNVPGKATGRAQVFANFEGLSNQDNFNLFGFRVNPPDPVGDVGPFHYVEMTNLAVAVYDKAGNPVMGPLAIGDLWAGFAIDDCTDPSGDPIVVYDQLVNRWILSQFTTRGFDDPTLPFYNCVAISASPDPTGEYYRYAFITQPDSFGGIDGYFFPDYPKYGVWTDAYILTTRDFGLFDAYGISVYALEKAAMIEGNPNARAVQFFLDGNDPNILPLIGDGLLPADIDGSRRPRANAAAPIFGTQDDNFPFYGATFDAINVFELSVQWTSTPRASLQLAAQLPVAGFDSVFPCAPTSRDCLPQPGITNPAQYLDVLSYRQRPTHRLAYRNFGGYEAMVTNQSVEARPGIAGVRWYEVRRANGQYSIYQQGTYAPDDGVHRWMGSAAMDRDGNMAIGYSVVNGVNVYPGIRYATRLAGDALGEITAAAESTIIDGTGVQTTTNSRWGDYTSLNVDPVDDCTFWYVNEYYTAAGQASSVAGWQTRIASFRLPACSAAK